jgi:aminopeptidase N
MIKNSLIFLSALLFFYGCSSTKSTKNNLDKPVELGEVVITPTPEMKYQAEAEKKFELIHTKLDVKFDWEKQHLLGVANLTLKPYFYNQSTLELDAKSFDIHQIQLIGNTENKALKFEYDTLLLTILLDKTYTKNDTIQVMINYTAKPNETKQTGSSAINDAKGLYFINPLGETPNKPKQIWTQGETESNSCWFPTIDKPNQKTSQEINITVEKNMKTLSNGKLAFQTENPDGTRTDYWVQKKKHAPYLVMMAIGDFAVFEDSWRDSVEVNYYVEHEYAPYAKDIFGKTPTMLTFYSDILGVDYPWDKYHQVVVRDYVSGAMENTSAVIHGDFLHQTKREMIDGDNQDIIAHELFHHWFGDLVTCESWSNLPLNESFATYGEYLWREFAQGKESADEHLYGDKRAYLWESKRKQVDMIRFHYKDKEDMFDSHSYAKGGCILHQLRDVVGDEAFFTSLKTYLNDNAHQAAEIHHLRLAFEKVTGQDLNWFFNQWFLASGHPVLSIKQNYLADKKELTVTVEQLQDFTKTPVYQLPVAIDIYTAGNVKREFVVITKQNQSFVFQTDAPKLVNFDAKKVLLAEKTEEKPLEQWIYQYLNAPLLMDRFDAINNITPFAATNELAFTTLQSALTDKSDFIRTAVIKQLKDIAPSKKDEILPLLEQLAAKDNKSLVRAEAIAAMVDYYPENTNKNIIIQALQDSSYAVIEEALIALGKIDGETALKQAQALEKEPYKGIKYAIAEIYATHGNAEKTNFFVTLGKDVSGYDKFGFVSILADFIIRFPQKESLEITLPLLTSFKSNDYFDGYLIYVLDGIAQSYKADELVVEEQIKKAVKQSQPTADLEAQKVDLIAARKTIGDLLEGMKK